MLMYQLKVLFTLFLIESIYTYEEEFHRKLARDNKLNKAVWIKNSMKTSYFENPSQKDFIFRANSMDTDNFMQDQVNFVGVGSPNKPYSSYFDRSKRSYDENNVQLPNSKGDTKTMEDDDLRAKDLTKNIHKSDEKSTNRKTMPTTDVEDVKNNSETNDSKLSTRRIKVVRKANINNNKQSNTTSKPKINRNVFDRDHSFWPKILTTNIDVQTPKTVDGMKNSKTEVKKEEKTTKLTNGKGLNKLITALTRALKKVMGQFENVKKVETNLKQTENINNDKILKLNRTLIAMLKKQREFYVISKKVNEIESKLNAHEEYLEKKDRDINEKLNEIRQTEHNLFEHQKSFIDSQQLILAQNKKLSNKLLMLAKSQNEIFKKQNYLTQLLKNKSEKTIEPMFSKAINKNIMKEDKNFQTNTTDSMKINLFNIPVQKKLKNQDTQLLREKDIKTVDDLIYKYYFNNTLIDELFKDHIESVVGNPEFMSKRRDNLKTTILYPLNTQENYSISTAAKPLVRDRRWINHRSKRRRIHKSTKANVPKVTTDIPKDVTEPFVEMAKNFCKKIGQNTNEQELKWCIEKALRKLHYLDMNKPIIPTEIKLLKDSMSPPTTETTQTVQVQTTTAETPISTTITVDEKMPESNERLYGAKPAIFSAFFPGNDELESNLKEFDMTPDNDGNVYYDGSVHTSGDVNVSLDDTISDAKPDVDSNGDVDPMVLSMKAKRKAMITRLKENIMKRLSRG